MRVYVVNGEHFTIETREQKKNEFSWAATTAVAYEKMPDSIAEPCSILECKLGFEQTFGLQFTDQKN